VRNSILRRPTKIRETSTARLRAGVATVSADVTDETAAHRILAEIRPDILVLNAGARRRWDPWIS
jgi:NAD(P)-dependent dehydrogenase (short-subunit alcohol dehydrogenase family)